MEKPESPELSFETIDTSDSGSWDAGYVAAVVLLVCGAGMLLAATSPGIRLTGIACIAAACLIYAHLLRKAPELRYFPYLWLDQSGIHYTEGSSPADRVAHFAWSEIARAEVCNEDGKALVLTLTRKGMSGVPIYLAAEHADEAARAIRAFIDPAPVH